MRPLQRNVFVVGLRPPTLKEAPPLYAGIETVNLALHLAHYGSNARVIHNGCSGRARSSILKIPHRKLSGKLSTGKSKECCPLRRAAREGFQRARPEPR
jgi:hypothetical protein